MSRTNKRALITGIHGFTGRYMAAELEAHGYRVFGLGSHSMDERDYHQADLADSEKLSAVVATIQPDVIVHLAAVAFVGHDDANAFYRVNLIGSRNLLEAIAVMGKRPDCVLLASSANVYGNTSEGILDEGMPPAPANDYAVSKLAMEYMAHLYSGKLPIVIARPFNYTGIGQADNFLISKIVSHFRAGASTIELGNLDVSRDFSDVRSVVQAYRLLLDCSLAHGQTINVSTECVYSLREIIDLCETITGRSIDVTVNPAFVRQNEVKILRGSAERLRGLLGNWAPIPLSETLHWMLTAGQ
ncbi:GDP-mannose 4,6-dehydratase [Pollutimonas bauzanensis]|uniref:GDP-D-mannose dehydratase n=1 Tax=Pollutimonas bauzanensis TaxID=658167 RepID=A0A1M6BJQ3_9BURK|nr:GDP-mannose 4,6-dehydratase [Pollutimonas bauzanensis]SHI49010.1 GDP-D-mannose dehydratase [Pollutimonas bauzanensis]